MVAAVRAGESVVLTVNGTPVADVVPHRAGTSPWVPAAELRRIIAEAGADSALLNDLADVRGALLDD